MRNFTKRIALLWVAVLTSSIIFAQAGTIAPQAITEATSSITLKTARALFSDQPVAVANELFGGLHSVQTVAILNGSSNAALDSAELQIGMLVYVADVNMYFRYIGDPNTTGFLNGATNLDPVYGSSLDHWEDLAAIVNAANGDRVFEGAIADTALTGTFFSAAEPIRLGDIYLTEDRDTNYVYDGDQWKHLSYTQHITYDVFINTLGGTVGTLLESVVDAEAFRTLLANDAAINCTSGLIVWYPARWGDFTYSVDVGAGVKLELTNGISVDRVAAGADIGNTTVPADFTTVAYKKVTVASRTFDVFVE
jgi:hypothetical protein